MWTSKQEIEQSDNERSMDGSESSKTGKKKKTKLTYRFGGKISSVWLNSDSSFLFDFRQLT